MFETFLICNFLIWAIAGIPLLISPICYYFYRRAGGKSSFLVWLFNEY